MPTPAQDGQGSETSATPWRPGGHDRNSRRRSQSDREPTPAAPPHKALASLAQCGVWVDAAYYCWHGLEEGCSCRKPRPGMLLRAAAERGLDLSRAFMIGDRASDIEAGMRAGCRTIC
jgi:histidinol phosphatase-like enzyme